MLAARDFDALRVKAVIFDVDGTLADTERASFQVLPSQVANARHRRTTA